MCEIRQVTSEWTGGSAHSPCDNWMGYLGVVIRVHWTVLNVSARKHSIGNLLIRVIISGEDTKGYAVIRGGCHLLESIVMSQCPRWTVVP